MFALLIQSAAAAAAAMPAKAKTKKDASGDKPVGKTKAQAEAKAKDKAGGNLVQAEPSSAAKQAALTPPLEYHDPNVAWRHKVQLAVDKVKGYFGQDLETKDALSVNEGFMAPVDEDVLKARVADASFTDPVVLTGGVNILWANPLTSLTPNVAINGAAIEKFMANTWPTGVVRPLTEPIDFCLEMPLKKGGLTRVSPDETQHALILQVAKRISEGADEAEMERWRRCLLSASGRFIRVQGFDGMYFWCTNARRRLRDAAAAIVHLASQIICDIWLFKAPEYLINLYSFPMYHDLLNCFDLLP